MRVILEHYSLLCVVLMFHLFYNSIEHWSARRMTPWMEDSTWHEIVLKNELWSFTLPILVSHFTFKLLTMGYECERDDPTVAFFNFDKNRPRRLAYMGDFNATNGEHEAWCIRNLLGSELDVVPSCNGYNPFKTIKLGEVYFHEIVWWWISSYTKPDV